MRGEGRELVSLFWKAREQPLQYQIVGQDNFTIEDLTVYVEGNYKNVIAGRHNVTIQRIRMRANLHTRYKNFAWQKSISLETFDKSGIGILITGDRARILDNDIYHTHDAIQIRQTRWGIVSRNQLDAGYSPVQAYSFSNLIWEDNVYIGSDPRASGIGISLYYGNSACHHLYYARNKTRQMYGGDREAITLDGHGTAYLGGVESVQGVALVLASDPWWGKTAKDWIPDWHNVPARPENAWGRRGITLYILSGKGAGQCRNLTNVDGRKIEVDRPFAVAPDATSVLSIGKFNRRHLFIDNEFADAGTGVQLYPPNFENIVAGSTIHRTLSTNGGGTIGAPGAGSRVEPSFFNQFLNNTIFEGA